MLMRRFLIVSLLLLTVPVFAQTRPAQQDRWEGMNRRIFAFNELADKYLMKPVAKGYKKITPRFVDDSITRMFENIHDLRSSINNLLQWEWYNAGQNFGRFTVNSTLGVVGIFDVASDIRLKKFPDDLGSTFAVWGMPEGPYMVLPFLGPSTLRDTAALFPEDYLRAYHYIDHDLTRYSVVAVYAIDLRADLLDFESVIVGDRYSFIRDYYIQSRRLKAGEQPAEDDFGADQPSAGDDWDQAPAAEDDW